MSLDLTMSHFQLEQPVYHLVSLYMMMIFWKIMRTLLLLLMLNHCPMVLSWAVPVLLL